MASYAVLATTLLGLATAQSIIPNTSDNHPKLTTWKCTVKGGCSPLNTAVVIDSASHWIHQKNNQSLGCGNWGSGPDPVACPNKEECADNCVMESIQDYSTYGVTTQGDNLRMDMFNPTGGVASPRLYLLGEDRKNYEYLQLTGNELSFDVDVSKLPCGMNGALYLSEMKKDGGKSAEEFNGGGAAYGTGYCDAQCFVTPWVDGVGNIDKKGVCCNEMDVWEANSRANQIAPHTCKTDGLFLCEGDECGAKGLCDKNGCGDNPYRHRNAKDYYGPGLKVDTSKPFTVVTQFPSNAEGVLQQIVRKYVQNGVVIENAAVNVTTMDQAFCSAQGGAEMFNALGGMAGMGGALARGMVLAMSIWWDEGGHMTWLDSGESGPCNATEGDPKIIRQIEKDPTVTFSKIKWGEIGSTFSGAAQNSTMYRWRA